MSLRALFVALVLTALFSPNVSAQNQDTMLCTVIIGSDTAGNPFWSLPTWLPFDQCAGQVGEQSLRNLDATAYGKWGETWILVNGRREIYHSPDRQTWTFRGRFQPTDGDGDGIADNEDACPALPESYNGIFDKDGCPDTLLNLTSAAIEDIDVFWKSAFEERGLTYAGPGAEAYEVPMTVEGCGELGLNNAFYCRARHTVYFDVGLMLREVTEFGDFAPVVILAHEWGHAIQGLLNTQTFSIANELQADCLAGAYAHSLVHAPRTLTLDPGDLDEGAQSLFFKGDPEEVPWFHPQAHGPPQQRAEAYALGLVNGVDGCFQ